MMKICKICKKEFYRTPKKSLNAKFCSKKCFGEDLKITQKGKHFSPKTEFKKGHHWSKDIKQKMLKNRIGKKDLFSENQKQEIIKLYGILKSTRKVAKQFNCTKPTIARVLKDNGLIIKYNMNPKKVKAKQEIRKCLCGCGSDVSGWSHKTKMLIRYLPGHNNMEINKRNQLRDFIKKNNMGKTYEEIYGIERAIEIRKKLSVPYEEKVGEERAKELKEKASNFMTLNNPMKNPEISKKVGLKISGEKNYMWLGGKSSEPYDIQFNKEFKYLIRFRDNFSCINCGISEQKHLILIGKRLHVHHIDYNKKNTCLQNCCTLCRKCNFLANKNRSEWTEYYREKLFRLYNYQYKLNLIKQEQEVKKCEK